MSTEHRWIATLLALSLLTACATTAPVGARLSAHPVYVTGSHIPVPVDRQTGLPQSAAPTQSVTQDELDLTGEDDVAPALRRLVPELH